jgi:hypothetical protein
MHADAINITAEPTSDNKFYLKISTLEGEPLEEYNDLTLETAQSTINTKSAYVQVIHPDLLTQPDLIGEKSC